MEDSNTFGGVACARRAPKVNHLLFADDSILFGKANIQSREAISTTLKKYELASRQRINFQKSMVNFSPNVDEELKGNILNFLGLSSTETHDWYLWFTFFCWP